MKQFLLNITYFLIILLGINILLYFGGKKLYFGNYHKYSLDYKSYLFADSHGEALMNLTEKYGIFNFSAGSDSYIDIYRKIEFLVSKTKVDTIYLTTDDYSLGLYREKVNNSDRSQFYITYNSQINYYEYLKLRYLKNYVVLFQPQTGTILKYYALSKIQNEAKINNNRAFEWSKLSADERLLSIKYRLQLQFPSDKPSSILHQSLLDIIKICKANNIVLIGLKFPLSPEYIESLGNKSFGADNILKSGGCKVLDYKKLFADQNNYFGDQDHLNKEGAYKFVEFLHNDSSK